MKAFRRVLTIAAITMTLAALTSNANANTFEDIARKLGRGVANVGFGVFEIPIKVWDMNQEDGGIAALTAGVFQGLGYFIAREFVGVAEIITFPLPLPGCPMDPNDVGWGYGPIMYPEFVFDITHNPYNFVYPNSEIIQ